ncbi:MAG TPA: O-antigen ligase family protein, partial [Gaiellaceae bacterium]|nr:O-antigen ligase family protein [Gaiellaceae bacterium]
WAYTRPALVESGAAESDRVSDGAMFAVLAVVGVLVVGGALLLGFRRQLDEWARGRAKLGLRVAAGGVGVAVALVLAVAIGDAVSSGRSCAEVANDPSRLGSLDPNSRWCWWNEAWDVFAGRAPEGAGAGTFEIARKRYRLDARAVRRPHSVPLQQLADGGVVALGLFLALVGAAAATCVCAVGRLRGAERAAGAALVAAPAAYLAHSLVDYDWDFLATTGPVMTSLGVLAAAGRRRGDTRGQVLLAVGAVVMALAVLFSFAAPRLADRSVRASTRALFEGELEQAQDRALRGRFWNPFSVDAVFALARVEEQRGRFDAAERRYIDAVELQPSNPETWYALGLFEFQVHRDMCDAYRYLNEAYTLDPAGSQWVPGGELDQARDAVNAGACAPSG